MQNQIIDIFTPPKFTRTHLDLQKLDRATKKKNQYASKGRYALYQILKSLSIEDSILIPAYICETVLVPLEKLNIRPVFCDLDVEDLNPSLSSIDFLSRKYDVKAVLVASMYGNPANLAEIEEYCQERGIALIDDSAQSFGATLNGRMIGTFGEAGFFSFSPGKPTAGHMGAFFWSDNGDYRFERTRHNAYHWIVHLDFYFNRLHIYSYKKFRFFRILSLIERFYRSSIEICDDDIAPFERDILGGIINDLGVFRAHRQKVFHRFVEAFSGNEYFKIVKSIRGAPNNHKLVVLCRDRKIAGDLIRYLSERRIFSLNGYRLLTLDLGYLPNAEAIDYRVVELPIENDGVKVEYLFDALAEYRYREIR